LRVAVALLGLAYPLLVYFSLTRFDVRHLALAVVALAALRGALSLRAGAGAELRAAAAPFVGAAVLAGLAAWLDDGRVFLFVPALVNAALLFGFTRTLWKGPPLVETFARLQVEHLPPDEVAYCRTVTVVWSLFFLANGGVALALAWFGSLEAWTLYNGLVAYLLIALLFSVELTYRAWRFRRYGGGPADAIFRRLFPPRQHS